MRLLSWLGAAALAATCASAYTLTPADYAAAVRNWRKRSRRARLAARQQPSGTVQTGFQVVFTRYVCQPSYTGINQRGQTVTVPLSSCASTDRSSGSS